MTPLFLCSLPFPISSISSTSASPSLPLPTSSPSPGDLFALHQLLRTLPSLYPSYAVSLLLPPPPATSLFLRACPAKSLVRKDAYCLSYRLSPCNVPSGRPHTGRFLRVPSRRVGLWGPAGVSSLPFKRPRVQNMPPVPTTLIGPLVTVPTGLRGTSIGRSQGFEPRPLSRAPVSGHQYRALAGLGGITLGQSRGYQFRAVSREHAPADVFTEGHEDVEEGTPGHGIVNGILRVAEG